MKNGPNGIIDYERVHPCTCGHYGNTHWHDWTEYHRTTGEYTCHALFCRCIKYAELQNRFWNRVIEGRIIGCVVGEWCDCKKYLPNDNLKYLEELYELHNK